MQIAIITGASSGLGNVFFEKVLERYPILDEYWVIARNENKLKELAEKHPQQKVRIVPLDLAAPRNLDTFEHLLQELKPDIRVLINNAGFDKAGLFREMRLQDIYMLMNLNVMGTTMVSRLCLPYMSKGSYQIITGSIGSFAPLPWRAVYSASKAYVRFFARALHEEERKRGVNIMLLSPGNMNTAMFRANASGEEGKLSFFPFLDLEKETVRSMQKAEKGCAAYTPRIFYKLYRLLAKIVPSAIMVRFTSVEGSIPKA